MVYSHHAGCGPSLAVLGIDALLVRHGAISKNHWNVSCGSPYIESIETDRDIPQGFRKTNDVLTGRGRAPVFAPVSGAQLIRSSAMNQQADSVGKAGRTVCAESSPVTTDLNSIAGARR